MDARLLGDWVIEGAERGLWPDPLIRWGIRRVVDRRLQEARLDERLGRGAADLLRRLREAPITVEAPAANRQHYEVPTAFFQAVLGPYLKYSCGYWPAGVSTLAQSERAMLELTAERAELRDGMRVLDLGCGWGSFTLYLAERLRGCRITAVSNSATQRAFIEAECRARGLGGVEVITADAARLELDEGRFDRVVSIEMMEHVRNHRALLRRIDRWLAPEGKLFVHIFCHRQFAYLYEDQGADDWMTRHFFTGGMMPSYDWLPQIAEDAGAPGLQARWPIAGRHYAHTCNAWLAQLDERRAEVLRILREGEGGRGGLAPQEAERHLQRWRMFFMACAELFDHGGGGEWFVGHYLFHRR